MRRAPSGRRLRPSLADRLHTSTMVRAWRFGLWRQQNLTFMTDGSAALLVAGLSLLAMCGLTMALHLPRGSLFSLSAMMGLYAVVMAVCWATMNDLVAGGDKPLPVSPEVRGHAQARGRRPH